MLGALNFVGFQDFFDPNVWYQVIYMLVVDPYDAEIIGALLLLFQGCYVKPDDHEFYLLSGELK
eukprot:6904616-Ditylum_brightwellii.AAC.1